MEIELNPWTKKFRNFAVGVVSKSSLTTAEIYFALINAIWCPLFKIIHKTLSTIYLPGCNATQ